MSEYIALSWLDLALAAIFLLLNAALSLALRLGVERQLLFNAVRMVVQLLLIGLVLKTVFALASPLATALIAIVMITFAGREIRSRQQRRLRGLWGYSIGAGAMMTAGMIVTIFALTLQIQPEPWWSPRYALPLFGMILGNTMTGVSLGLDTLHTTLHRERRSVEAQLALGRTRFEAVSPAARIAMRSGFMPIINSMAASGVVSIPGMMTGQILSGVDPNEAVKYQLLITMLISGATGFGVIGAILGSLWRLTDERHRLRLERMGDA